MTVILRTGDPLPQEGALRFRLFYEGRFLSANGDPQRAQADKKADHKHEIRRVLHRQMRDLWSERRFLRSGMTSGEIFGLKGERKPLKDKLADISPVINGFRFIPLVHENLDLLCDLKILLMRRDRPGDRPGRAFNPRDIDNRLKVLFDALKMPVDAAELGDNHPSGDDNPMFVLLQKDELISSVSVETDDLLDPPPEAGSDDSYARVLIDVTVAPFEVNTSPWL